MEVDVTVEVDVVSRSWTQRWCRGAGRSSGVAGLDAAMALRTWT